MHPIVKDMEALFLASDKVFPESTDKVVDRWTYLLQAVPGLAGRDLLADMTDIFQHAEQKGGYYEINAARNLACLQNRFYQVLYEAGRLPTHVMRINVEYGLYWQRRLWDREQVSGLAQRTDYRIRKAKQLPYHQPHWIN